MVVVIEVLLIIIVDVIGMLMVIVMIPMSMSIVFCEFLMKTLSLLSFILFNNSFFCNNDVTSLLSLLSSDNNDDDNGNFNGNFNILFVRNNLDDIGFNDNTNDVVLIIIIFNTINNAINTLHIMHYHFIITNQ